MEKIPLLLNPEAGSFTSSGLKNWLAQHEAEFDFIYPKSPEHLRETAADLAQSGQAIVAVAGGDGTLMQAAHGLMGSDCAMAVIPSGSMNVFAREIGLGSRRFDRALEAMRSGLTQQIDIFKINNQPFIQLAGFGLDARVVKRVTPRMKKWLGAPIAHIISAIKVTREHCPHLTVTLPSGEQLEGNQVLLGNGKKYGGAALLFSHAQLDDQKLDMAVIDHQWSGVFFEMMRSMILGGARPSNVSDFTELRQLESCTISSDEKFAYQLDGDYAGTIYPGEQAVITRSNRSLKVCVLPSTPAMQPQETVFGNLWDYMRELIGRSKC